MSSLCRALRADTEGLRQAGATSPWCVRRTRSMALCALPSYVGQGAFQRKRKETRDGAELPEGLPGISGIVNPRRRRGKGGALFTDDEGTGDDGTTKKPAPLPGKAQAGLDVFEGKPVFPCREKAVASEERRYPLRSSLRAA